MTDVPVYRPGKRKRGRPRKDSNLLREHGLFSPLNPNNITKTQTPDIRSPRSPHDPRKLGNVDINHRDGTGNGMVGRMIYGVIEGSFDAGYFISVRMSNSNTPFRGVIFHSQKVVPVTATNDIAPNAKMYQRREIPVSAYNLQSCISPQSRKMIMQPSQATKQEFSHHFRPSTSQPFTPNDNFTNHSTFMLAEDIMPRNNSCSNMGEKMSNQSETMHMFEFSTPPKESRNIAESSFNETINSLLGDASINQNHKQNNPNVETHRNFMADVPQSTFGSQHHNNEIMYSEMEHQNQFVRNGWQSPTAQLQQEPQSVNSQHEQTNTFYQKSEKENSDKTYQNQFTFQSHSESQEHRFSGSDMHFVDQLTNSPNLELDLASAMHENSSANDQLMNELRNGNLGYHQALVSGNPLMLPQELTNEHIDFKTSNNAPQQTESMNVKSTEAGAGYAEAGGPSASNDAEAFKLEHSTSQLDREKSTGCITDMDFVLNEVMQGTESHGNQANVHRNN